VGIRLTVPSFKWLRH